MDDDIRVDPATERFVQGESQFDDPNLLIQDIKAAMRCICVVERSDGEGGTGLLIGPDLVLTNHHVALNGDDGLVAERCRFDFSGGALNGFPTPGRTVEVVEAILSSPPTVADRDGAAAGFDPWALDFAVLRLAERVGEQADAFGMPRHWISLPPKPPEPRKGMRVALLQHPRAANGASGQEPVRMTQGRVVALLDGGARLGHDAASRKGSSGGGLFDYDDGFALLGLHNAGAAIQDGRAVPATRIAAHVGQSPVAGSILRAVPPRAAYARKLEKEARRRREVAQLLMARDGEEQRLIDVRTRWPMTPDAAAGGALVHVVVSCEHDQFEWFQNRMGMFSLVVPPKRLGELQRAALCQGLDGPPWDYQPLSWPKPGETHENRLHAALNQLRTWTEGVRNTLVVFTCRDDGRLKAAAELKLLTEFAASAVQERWGISPARVQVVVHYRLDVPGGRPRLEKMWNDMDGGRPAGFGMCVRLPEVRHDDLHQWRNVLDDAWGVPDSFDDTLKQVFASSRSLPLGQAEDRIRPSLDALIATALEQNGPARGGW